MAKPKKAGRPPAVVKLDFQVMTRLDEGTLSRLNAAASKLERAPAWVLRKALEEWLERNGA